MSRANLSRPLARFLRERGVTVLRCHPHLLATLDEDLPDLRLVVVSGAPCPPELVARWHRPGRHVIGTYGPPEATVTTSWAELEPGKLPTLGTPLPGYSLVVLDPEDPYRALPHGEVGEIGIAGIGVARGFVNRSRVARESFVADFLRIPANPSGRIFRTGDLGRVTTDGEIEYHGRLHNRSRGERLELAPRAPSPPVPEPQPAHAIDGPAPLVRLRVVTPPQAAPRQTPPRSAQPEHAVCAPGSSIEALFTEVLAGALDREDVASDAHFFDDLGADSLLMARFCARVRKHPDLPTVAMPDIYQHPTIARLVTALAPAQCSPAVALTPTSSTELMLGEVLAGALECDEVSTDAHFFDDLGADSLLMARFCARVRKHPDLPAVAMPDIYRYPTIASLAASLAAPASSTELLFAEVLAGALECDEVSTDAHFFDDLGADSLLMARFCARVRKHPDLPAVAMPDIYRYPTIEQLSGALSPTPVVAATEAAPRSTVPSGPGPISTDRPARANALEYASCGALQLLFLLGYSSLALVFMIRSYHWVAAGTDLTGIYLRALAVGAVGFSALCTIPVLAKWVLIGRWKPQLLRIWSLRYVRFWIVKTLVRLNPLVVFAGSPLYSLYLRALGAHVGRGAVVFSSHVPVCTDLLKIGEGAVIRKDVVFNGYRAQLGVIETGRVALDSGARVGEASVLDIETTIGKDAVLAHASSLHRGQAIPAGESWHGSPAVPSSIDYRIVAQTRCGPLRQFLYPAAQMFIVLFLLLPLATGGLAVVTYEVPQFTRFLDTGPHAHGTWDFYLHALELFAVLFLGVMLLGLLIVTTVPRLLSLGLAPGRTYRLYGVHYWLHRAVAMLTNVGAFTRLTGDSSVITGYLRRLGYRLTPVEQTGSNFGLVVKHDDPYLSRVGTGTVVADGLSFVNADYSSGSFRLDHAEVGSRNFLGNNIVYPAGARTGDNCLLATKVMVPLDGPMREGVGLLGSPSFEIPRTVERDARLDQQDPEKRRRGLAAKDRHNAVTILLYLAMHWCYFLGIGLIASVFANLERTLGVAEIVLADAVVLLFTVIYFVLVSRSVTFLQVLAPDGCSIYDRPFWRHERFWKIQSTQWFRFLDGTPFKGLVWRSLGARVGARLFDDGCDLIEKTFVTIGDDCTFNARSIIQCHSQEDGAFKSDRIAIGGRCTLGVGAFVHYGTTLGDDSILGPDTFLMKGEDVPESGQWAGNPARPTAGMNRSPTNAHGLPARTVTVPLRSGWEAPSAKSATQCGREG